MDEGIRGFVTAEMSAEAPRRGESDLEGARMGFSEPRGRQRIPDGCTVLKR